MLDVEIVQNVDGKFIVFRNDTLGQHLMRGERWEPHFAKLANAFLKPGDFAVDIGANIGYNAIIMAKAVGDEGRIEAFEPLRITYQQLCGNVVLNGLENIYCHRIALGHANNVAISMAPVDYHEEGINIMDTPIGKGGDVVLMRTLDSYELKNISFIKIDVQGCEHFVLKGAEQTIQSTRPLMFVEIEEPLLRNRNTSSEEVMMKIFSLGYHMVWTGEESPVDWLAVPVERTDILERVPELLVDGFQVFQKP